MPRSLFRHSPLWKWFIVVVLVGSSAVLALWKPRPRPIKVELLPFTDSPPAWDGSYPYLSISLINPGTQLKFEASISRTQPTVRHDSPVNAFQVDLHSGMFVLRQTDLFVPDVPPLPLTPPSPPSHFHVPPFAPAT